MRGTPRKTDCGCAGIYTAHAGIELYAEVFAAAGALDRLEGFAGQFGADFYGLPRNTGEDHAGERGVEQCRPELPVRADTLVPFRGGGSIAWKIA